LGNSSSWMVSIAVIFIVLPCPALTFRASIAPLTGLSGNEMAAAPLSRA
jgi:hypothetical protein